MEVLTGGSRGAEALAEVHGGLRGRAHAVQHEERALVRHPGEQEVVPQPRGVADPPRTPRGDEAAVPRLGPRREEDQDRVATASTPLSSIHASSAVSAAAERASRRSRFFFTSGGGSGRRPNAAFCGWKLSWAAREV